MDFVDQRFEDTSVELDGNNYTRCTFHNVDFVYGGGSLAMQDCNLDRFTWRFTGDLANGLFALHQLFGTEGLIAIIRGFTDPGQGEVALP